MTHFQALWPIRDTSLPFADLIEEARQDLPAVAARHNARITGTPRLSIVDGIGHPGSGGAELCVVATAPAGSAAPRNYRRTA